MFCEESFGLDHAFLLPPPMGIWPYPEAANSTISGLPSYYPHIILRVGPKAAIWRRCKGTFI